MKTRIILSLVILLTVLSVKAQEPVETKIFPTNQIISPHKIEVTFQKTVHILFPSEVKYVDLGSFDIIADKATGAENVVRIKAAVKGFEGETNFSVITADGCFYSFNVVYKDEPTQLSIEMEDWLRDNPEGGIAGDRMFVKLKELGGETPLVVNVNLAVLNILPLPVVDGGHVVMNTIWQYCASAPSIASSSLR